MNDKKRERLSHAYTLLGECEGILNAVLDAEQDSMDNMSENLQFSERYEKMEVAVENIEDAIGMVCEAQEKIKEASA